MAAISLKERPSSASSRGPLSGARALRSPAASAPDATRSRSIRRAIEVPSPSAAATATSAEAAATARIFTSSPMWNITQPERSTAASGSATASSAKPRELEADGREQAQEEGGREPGREGRSRDDEGERDHGTKR